MAAPYPQLVLFGDSLLQQSVYTQDGFSFQAELQAHFLRRLDVVNRGLSGYTTENVLKYLPEIFPPPASGPSAPKMEYIVVLLGANDAVLPDIPGLHQHVPIDTYKKNLLAIVTHPNIVAHDPKILLVTPPPVDEIYTNELDLQSGWPRGLRHASVSAAYSQKAREVAAEVPRVVLVDLYKVLMDRAVAATPDYEPRDGRPMLGSPECGIRGGLQLLLHDGLHMSGEAYRLFLAEILPHVKRWPRDATEDFVLPGWKDLNTS